MVTPFELKAENDRLRQELAFTIAERDEWMNKAIEISHQLTYTMEYVNHKGLQLILKPKPEPPADGPEPGMFE